MKVATGLGDPHCLADPCLSILISNSLFHHTWLFYLENFAAPYK